MESQEFGKKRKAEDLITNAGKHTFNVVGGMHELRQERNVKDVVVPRPDSSPSEENFRETENKRKEKPQMEDPKNIALSCQGATLSETWSANISYEYFSAAINPGASVEELRYFYPERAVAFHSFDSFISISRIREFVQVFGDVSVLKFLPSGRGLCAIAVFKERASAFAAILYFSQEEPSIFGPVRNRPLVEFICSADQNTVGGCEEITNAGEEVSSNTVVTVLVPEDVNYAKVLLRVCVGEVREIVHFSDEEKCSLMSIEFVEPLDAAISAYCSVDRKVVLSSFYGRASIWNKKTIETHRISTTFNEYKLVTKMRDAPPLPAFAIRQDVDTFSGNIELVRSTEIVRLSLRDISNIYLHVYHPVCFLNLPSPLEFIFIQVLNPNGVKCKKLFAKRLDYTCFVKFIKQTCDYSCDSHDEITPWVSYFFLDIQVRYSPPVVVINTVIDKTYLFPKTCPQFFQKDIRNFAFVSPRNEAMVRPTEIPPIEDKSNSAPTEHLQVEQTEKGNVFVHVPSYSETEYKTFCIPFIFQYPHNLSGLKLQTSAEHRKLERWK